MAYFKSGQWEQSGGITIVADCPHCGKGGIFDRVGPNDLYSSGTYFGSRMCINSACRGHIFYIQCNETILTYPPTTIPFNSDGIHEKFYLVLEKQLFAIWTIALFLRQSC